MPNGDANESHLSDISGLEFRVTSLGSRVTKLEKDLGTAVTVLHEAITILEKAFPDSDRLSIEGTPE